MNDSPNFSEGNMEDTTLKDVEERTRQLQILIAELLLENQLLRSRSKETTNILTG